jgi:hypothetical protein
VEEVAIILVLAEEQEVCFMVPLQYLVNPMQQQLEMEELETQQREREVFQRLSKTVITHQHLACWPLVAEQGRQEAKFQK